MSIRIVLVALIAASAAIGASCGQANDPRGSGDVASAVYTVARPSFGAAWRDFFGSHPKAEQPIPFPHKTHIEKGLACTEYCHEAVTKGPMAGIPSIKTCMICHAAIATDKPLIQKITNEYDAKGLDIPWQRVYGYPNASHVRFNHAPHIRANVDCATCHGKIAEQTVAERNVDLNMGFCVNCHRDKKVSNDCLTCHF